MSSVRPWVNRRHGNRLDGGRRWLAGVPCLSHYEEAPALDASRARFIVMKTSLQGRSFPLSDPEQ